MASIGRRDLMKAAALAAAAGAMPLGGCAPASSPPPTPNGTPFDLGVVSGFHSSSEVVLWTRLNPLLAPGASQVEWRLYDDAACTIVVESGMVGVGPATDWTAKVLVGGLNPDRSYWYRFFVDGVPSPVGRARTLPLPGASMSSLSLAFASCQNWGSGFYWAWDGIAAENIDGVVFLGDYIYETPSLGTYVGDLGAVLNGVEVRRDTLAEAFDVDSYRAKYRLYRSDRSLQAAHAAHPLIPVWDDHEFKNDYHRGDLLSDSARAQAAYQVWFEYMPVMPFNGTQIYRALEFGSLARLMMLDTRQYRDPQATGYQGPGKSPWVGAGTISDEAQLPGRTIMGTAQRDWFLGQLGAAQDNGVTWKLVGNQVMIAPTRILDLDTPELRALAPELTRHNGVSINMDSWESYRAERDLILDYLRTESIQNVAFLTGDIHCFWQQALFADYDDPSSPKVANEFVGGSISSLGVNVLGDDIAGWLEQSPYEWSPAFNYVDFRRNGYGLLRATPEEMTVDFRVVKSAGPQMPMVSSARFTVQPGVAEPTVQRINP